jgi:hypothetical protein
VVFFLQPLPEFQQRKEDRKKLLNEIKGRNHLISTLVLFFPQFSFKILFGVSLFLFKVVSLEEETIKNLEKFASKSFLSR